MELLPIFLCAFTILQDVSAYPARGNPYKPDHCIKMTPEKEQQINAIVTRLTDYLNNIMEEFEDFDIRLIKLDIESHSEDEIEEKDVKLQLTVNDCTEELGDGEEKKSETKDSNDEPKVNNSSDAPGEVSEEKDYNIDVKEKKSEETEENTSESNGVKPSNSVIETDKSDSCEKCPCICKSDGDIQANISNNTIGKDTTKLSKDANSIKPIKAANNKTQTSYESSPEDTILFYDFSETTDVNDEKTEITEIYIFNNEAKPEVMTLDLSGAGEDVFELIQRNNKPLFVYVQIYNDREEYIFL